jgi:vacuolar-type H+-ATPase subunit C/Vma6
VETLIERMKRKTQETKEIRVINERKKKGVKSERIKK